MLAATTGYSCGCDRSDFANIQGFLNHCRIVHQQEFSGHAEAARRCGVPVDDSEIPANHPARRMPMLAVESWMSYGTNEQADALKLKSPPRPVKPGIKEFDENVDLDTEDQSPIGASLRKWRASIKAAPGSKFEPESVPDVSGASDPSSMDWEPHKEDAGATANEPQDPNNHGVSANGASDPLNANAEHAGHLDDAGSSNESTADIETPQAVHADPATTTSMSTEPTVRSDNSIAKALTQTGLNSRESVPTSNLAGFIAPSADQEASLEGAARTSHVGDRHQDAGGSRFYIERKIIVGNSSKFIPPDTRKADLARFQFKWIAYLRGPREDPDITAYVKKVRFYLHPDYKPYDVVEITEPPFRLVRYGWGEFPIRLQIHFLDTRNKPLDIIHVLKFQTTDPELHEKTYDLELDRNTVFEAPRPERPRTRSGPAAASASDSTVDISHAFAISDQLQQLLSQLMLSIDGPATTGPESKDIQPAQEQRQCDQTDEAIARLGQPDAAAVLQHLKGIANTLPDSIQKEVGAMSVEVLEKWHGSKSQDSDGTQMGAVSANRDIRSCILAELEESWDMQSPRGQGGVAPLSPSSQPLITKKAAMTSIYCCLCGMPHPRSECAKPLPGLRNGKVSSVTKFEELLRRLPVPKEEAETHLALLHKPVTTGDASPIQRDAYDPSSPLSEQHDDRSEHRPDTAPVFASDKCADDKQLQWIWSEIRSLGLPVPQSRQDYVQAGTLAFEVTKAFLRELLAASLSECELDAKRYSTASDRVPGKERAEPDQARRSDEAPVAPGEASRRSAKRMLVPLHVFRALHSPSLEHLDFLTNRHMGI
ncbi:uncharacterized protein BJ171DRAFT_91905 [Polychytrium aggregatum]|uniref:uncharacterized protein n=1 Tax=Polychytrium aggregatum TaxID=110093 RepID=UPI0022FDC79C|nr:uncharacterized protein BJ171DRAFT_91905 [Polychytrium aggregatum]KAI9204930.1 hypothetical protein BJ171DRAFT_91905 [Polychytrium aggregatum]